MIMASSKKPIPPPANVKKEKEKQEQKNKNAELEKKLAELNKKLNEITQTNKNLQDRNIILVKKQSELGNEFSSKSVLISREKDTQTKTLQELQINLAQKQRELEQLHNLSTDSLDEIQEKLAKIREDNNEIKAKLHQAQEETRKLTEKNKEKTKENAKLAKENDDLILAIASTETKIEESKKSNMIMKKQPIAPIEKKEEESSNKEIEVKVPVLILSNKEEKLPCSSPIAQDDSKKNESDNPTFMKEEDKVQRKEIQEPDPLKIFCSPSPIQPQPIVENESPSTLKLTEEIKTNNTIEQENPIIIKNEETPPVVPQAAPEIGLIDEVPAVYQTTSYQQNTLVPEQNAQNPMEINYATSQNYPPATEPIYSTDVSPEVHYEEEPVIPQSISPRGNPSSVLDEVAPPSNPYVRASVAPANIATALNEAPRNDIVSQSVNLAEVPREDTSRNGAIPSAPAKMPAGNKQLENEIRYKKCLAKAQEIWYEDDFLQIGIIRDINQRMKSAAYKIFFGNKSPETTIGIQKFALVGYDTQGKTFYMKL